MVGESLATKKKNKKKKKKKKKEILHSENVY